MLRVTIKSKVSAWMAVRKSFIVLEIELEVVRAARANKYVLFYVKYLVKLIWV